MAQVTLDQFVKELFDDFTKLKAAINKREIKSDLGEIARQRIYDRTKRGQGVSTPNTEDPNVTQVQLRSLSPSYIRHRIRNARIKFTPGDQFSPSFSNLTLTGQMLDSLSVRLLNKGFKISTLGRRDDGQTNTEVSEHVQDDGRFFLNLTRRERNELSDQLAGRLNKVAEQLFT